MNLYLETSALVALMFGEGRHAEVLDSALAADHMLTSELTLLEWERTLVRAESLGGLGRAALSEHRARMDLLVDDWIMLPLSSEVLERAKRSFPSEPIRTLDALHVATAFEALRDVPDLAVLSLDERVRSNCAKAGITVLPV